MTSVIPIFVLSLPDCTSRREKTAHRLNDLSLPFEFLDAIDGRSGLTQQQESQIDRSATVSSHSRPLTDTEFGCALSHIKAYRHIVVNDIPYAMVLEDDAIPHPKLVEYLKGRYFEGLDLISLYYSRTYIRSRSAKRLFGGFKSYPSEPGIYIQGAVGYIVSIGAARFLLENALPVRSVADWPACTEEFKSRNSWFLVYPKLVDHARPQKYDDSSIIGSRHIKSKRRFLGVYIPPWKEVFNSYRRNLLYRLLGFRKIKR